MSIFVFVLSLNYMIITTVLMLNLNVKLVFVVHISS